VTFEIEGLTRFPRSPKESGLPFGQLHFQITLIDEVGIFDISLLKYSSLSYTKIRELTPDFVPFSGIHSRFYINDFLKNCLKYRA
jgi:hypothetical protein